MERGQEFVLAWLKKYRPYIKIRAIEKKLGIPLGTLVKCLKGSRKVPPKYLTRLKSFMQSFYVPSYVVDIEEEIY